ncbi:2-oxoisovalerate dehydrogenase subunit beta mitochondrial [Penicillium sp. IBT 35674x]|nr:2-oxoisovalerate dehydrogenase subunit beta mitochondrial [Penicillium sp. IBT 35674x]
MAWNKHSWNLVTAVRSHHSSTLATLSNGQPARRLNLPTDFSTSPLLHHKRDTFAHTPGLPTAGPSTRLNLFQSVNSALHTALAFSDRVLCYGQDVGFGGVFRCTSGLQDEFGKDRVFNSPITEQGMVFPAFDQIVNEASKFRYREGTSGTNLGGLVIRMPCGGVGHGALHIPGFRIVMPRSPTQAKGLLLSAILHSKDPVIFMEPKILYRAAIEEVPDEMYTLPLGKAEVLQAGRDLTIISYGRPLYTCQQAIEAVKKDRTDVSIELIDLRSIYPWDRETVLASVRKTGRAIIVHESMVNYGVGSEIAATIQENALFHLKSPVRRLGGWTTHTGLSYEKYILPDVTRVYDNILQCLEDE